MENISRLVDPYLHKLFRIVVVMTLALVGCTSHAQQDPDTPQITQAAPASMANDPGTDVQPVKKTPILALSGGKDVWVSASRCMDLDTGQLLEIDNPDCDFAFSLPSTDKEASVRFIPLSYASFAFDDVFWTFPDLTSCSNDLDYSGQPQWIKPTGEYYVCYQTDTGHWGILNMKAVSGDNLQIYWVTSPDLAELIAMEAAHYPVTQTPVVFHQATKTPTPNAIYSQGSNIWVNLDQGLELDQGIIQTAWNGSDDLIVSAGEIGMDGMLLDLLLQPYGNTAIQGNAGFEHVPSLADCKGVNSFQAKPRSIKEIHRFYCYQTSSGRFGYIYLHESNPGIGIRLDWVTWADISMYVVEPEATGTPPVSGAAVQVVIPAQLNGVKVFRPGQLFSFTWQLKNTGKRTWNTRYTLMLAEGNGMGGLEKKWIPYPIAPGMTVRLALALTAPKEPGTYTAVYWLVDDTGQRFGFGENGSRPLQLVINSGEPGLTLADGQGVTLAAKHCFDLDLGFPALNDPACDFSVDETSDPAMLQITSSESAFDFINPFATEPRLGQCKSAALSSGRRVLDLENWFVCYKTSQGRYGWLKILGTAPEGLQFDWKTYQ